MELNFDKEIDAILRKARESEFAFATDNPQSAIRNSQSHLDADEISAFAENALSETAKQFYTAHLADCDVCRKNLSSLILLNAEAESENVHAEEIVPISSAIPWYRKLFAFPNLAYTMGALVLLFSGIIGFTILQNVSNSSISEVSQSSERPNDTQEMSADSDAVPNETSPNAANSASNTASVSSSNSMTANTSANRAAMNSSMNTAAEKQIVLPNATPQVEMRREDDLALSKDKKVMSLDSNVSAGSVAEKRQEEKKEAEKNAETADAVKAAPVPPKTASPSILDNQTKSDAPSARAKKNSLESKSESASVGGKTFNRRNNVWYDTAYNGQSTINLTRGTNEYKKLDKDLRVIVENLGETVLIVWKDKAYRIQ
ncbi:MAG: hypothetical protein M3Q78_05500 [Acidobacteriota bacterium]|nr:hypothetical protein [Acidobacteriota bacterium]